MDAVAARRAPLGEIFSAATSVVLDARDQTDFGPVARWFERRGVTFEKGGQVMVNKKVRDRLQKKIDTAQTTGKAPAKRKPRPSRSRADLRVESQGSITQFWPVTRAARDWFEENVDVPPYARLGAAVCIETRYAPPIIEGAKAAGLVLVGGAP